jgi:hypothetical protein
MGRSPSLLTENGCPDTPTCETVTAADPWFTRETVSLAVVPSATPPKLTVFGDARSEPPLALAAALIIVPPKQPHNVNGKLHERTARMKRKSDESSRPGAVAHARESTAFDLRCELQAHAADNAVDSRLNGAQKRMSCNWITLRSLYVSCCCLARCPGNAPECLL